MKLKLAILSAFALSASAVTPSIRVKLGGGYTHAGFEVEHGFKVKAAAATDNKNGAAAAGDAGKDAKTDADKKKGVKSDSNNGFNGLFGVDVAFAKENFVFGVRGGMIYGGTGAEVKFKAEGLSKVAEAQEALDAAQKVVKDADAKATQEQKDAAIAAKKALNDLVDSQDSKNTAPQESEVSIKVDKGIAGFVGPMAGMQINDKLSVNGAALFTMRKLNLLIKEGAKDEVKHEHNWQFGLMPAVTVEYAFTDMISAFGTVGYDINMSTFEAKKADEKKDDKKADAAAKTADTTADAKKSKIEKAVAGNAFVATVGVSVKLM